MSDGIDNRVARDALGVVTEVLVAQGIALDELFYELFYSAANEAFLVNRGSHYHARKALKAQARSRATLKILLALGEAWNLQNNSKIERTN